MKKETARETATRRQGDECGQTPNLVCSRLYGLTGFLHARS